MYDDYNSYKYKEQERANEPVPPYSPGFGRRMVLGAFLGLCAWLLVMWAGVNRVNNQQMMTPGDTAHGLAVINETPTMWIVTTTPDNVGTLAATVAADMTKAAGNHNELATGLGTLEAKLVVVSTKQAEIELLNRDQLVRLNEHEFTATDNQQNIKWLWLSIYLVVVAIVAVTAGTIGVLVMSPPPPTPTLTPHNQALGSHSSFSLPLVEPFQNGFGTVQERFSEPPRNEPVLLRPVGTIQPVGDITPLERGRIVSAFSRFKSRTAVSMAIYGIKNKRTWDRIKAVLGEGSDDVIS